MLFDFVHAINPFARYSLSPEDLESQLQTAEMTSMPIEEYEDGSFRQITDKVDDKHPSCFGRALQKCHNCWSRCINWLTTPYEDEPDVFVDIHRPETSLQNLRANWCWIQDDEDGDDADEDDGKRMPPTTKNYVALGAVGVSVLGLSAVFRQEPIIAAGLTGSIMGSVKISYSQMLKNKESAIPKNTMRMIAAAALTASLVFHYVPDDPYGVVAFMRTLPLSDVAMAVFAKCELNKLKPEMKLVDFVNRRRGVVLSEEDAKSVKTKAKIISTIIQGIAAASLMNPKFFGTYIAAAGAVLSKAKLRRLIDMIWQKMDKMVERIKPKVKGKNGKAKVKLTVTVNAKDVKNQKIALACAYGTFATMAALSVAAYQLPIFRNPTLSLIPLAVGIISVDTLIRSAKAAVKSLEVPEYMPKPEPTCCRRVGSVAAGVGLLGLTVGISAVVGPSMISAAAVTSVSSNPGFAVVACQEAGAWIKVVSKKVASEKVTFMATLGMIAAGTGVYLARDLLGIVRDVTPGYGAALFFGTTLIGTALYLSKGFLRGDKVPVELEEAIPLQELEPVAEL